MNKVADNNVQNIKCSQMNTKNKSKKTKDLSQADELCIKSQEHLNETLANTLHINNINSNLTNGTSDHSNGSSEVLSEKTDGQGETVNKVTNDVNSVQHNDTSNNFEGKKTTMPSINRCLLDMALEKLEINTNNEDLLPRDDVDIVSYESELQMPEIMRLIQKDLSEPYSIYTYRYFIHNWPKLCFLARHEGKCIGAIVCKLDIHRNAVKRGYIAMLAVDEKYRKRKIGSRLVRKAIQAMINDTADEVVLETEITNKPALKLYENLGFVRDKRLFRYYLNGVDALRLKLWLR